MAAKKKKERPFRTEREFTRWFIECALFHDWKVAHFGNTIKFVRRGDQAVAIPDKDAAGFPDMVCVRERLLCAELKLAPNKPTATQVDWIESLRDAGVEMHVWNDRQLEEIEQTLATKIDPRRLARLFVATDGDMEHSVAVAKLLEQKERGRSDD